MPEINNLGKLLSLDQQLRAPQMDEVLAQFCHRSAGSSTLDGINDLLHGQILLPLHPVLCIVARPGPVQSQETRQSVDAQFAAKDLQGVSFKLLVGHCVEAAHGRFALLEDTGFMTATSGLPSRREALRMNPSSVKKNVDPRCFCGRQVQCVVSSITSHLQICGTVGDKVIQFDAFGREGQ